MPTGFDPAESDIAAVRFLVGDTGADGAERLTDEEITFALDQVADDIYRAAAMCARALAARYARRVDTRFETVETSYSQLRDSYEQLARTLDAQAKKRGGLGEPLAGGITQADVDSIRADLNRVRPFFYDSIFNNPPPSNDS
jgi:hypothetical protein